MHTGEGARKAEEWVGGQAQQQEEDKGWASDSGGTIKRRKSKGKASGTVRSVDSNSTAASDVLVLSPRQKRRTSLGVSGGVAAVALVPLPETRPKAKAERRASMPVRRAPESASLMSIVEGVARANRDGWVVRTNTNTNTNGSGSSASGSGSAGLMEVKAPRLDAPVVRGRSASAGTTIEGLPRAGPTIEGLPRAPGSGVLDARHVVAGDIVCGFVGETPRKIAAAECAQGCSSSLHPLRCRCPSRRNGKGKGKAVGPSSGDDDSDDGASISSYETGHETFEDDEGEETEHEEERPPPPPPHEYARGSSQRGRDYGYGSSDLSASSASTQHGGAPAVPQRRKSVRVSLQPTFSTTPPAIDDDDDDEEGARHPPWGERDRAAVDMWEDSSEEDVEYQKAKKLLSRVARKDKKTH
ncbi:hypothetical protein DFH09DRAFT_1189048 [Mycena vulgaris]|nr:hypothetical protein DFH09DRAFT_1189048 [Mycena vulgaris]